MRIHSLLSPKRTLCHVACGSKKRSLEVLADLIAEHHEEIQADELFEQFVARERLGSTGIGEGIAIPHCRAKTRGETIGALMTLESPIDYDSVDSKPVDIIFAMLVPEDSDADHLNTLANLVSLLQENGYVSSLRAANNGDELFGAATQQNEH